MRKFCSILLLAIFALPLLLALSTASSSAESRLAACCRRNGAHHCAMQAAAIAELASAPAFRAPLQRCPLYPAAVAPAHTSTVLFAGSAVTSADSSSHPAHSWQVQAWAHIARDGARQKRGPPALLLA